ncbi:MAG TPA: CPBP family intramembrane glutamic endopeptidase [Archangium sp.]
MNVFRDSTGAVRVGWIVALFTVICVVGVPATMTAFYAARLISLELPTRLDSPHLVFQTLPTLIAGALATVVCWAIFRVPTGLETRTGLTRTGLSELVEDGPTTTPTEHSSGQSSTSSDRPGWLALVCTGFLIGLATIAVCILVPVLAGQTTLHLASPPWWMGLQQLLTLAPAGLGEELMLRGLAFHAFKRRFGDWPAVLVSGSLFGVLHLTNPEGTWISSAVIALVGLWFALLTVRSGSLWMAAGVHVAWNFGEGFVFGHPVSGHQPASPLFAATWPAPGFWSGGDFGPEAAAFTAIVLVIAVLLTLRAPFSRGS